MNSSLSTSEARRQVVTQLAILSLSTFLLGLYYGRDLEAGFDLITLQTGLVGIMALVSVAHVSKRLGYSSGSSQEVERRLDRFTHTPDDTIRRFDAAESLRIRTPQTLEAKVPV